MEPSLLLNMEKGFFSSICHFIESPLIQIRLTKFRPTSESEALESVQSFPLHACVLIIDNVIPELGLFSVLWVHIQFVDPLFSLAV